MYKFLLLLCIASFSLSWDTPKPKEFKTTFELSDGTQSASYDVGIKWWTTFSQTFDEAILEEYGMTDAGLPLHTITLSKNGLTLAEVNKSSKTILLINNAIHPGEPDGVDASMLLYRDILYKNPSLLDSCILVCIPYYNIGGALNRNSHSRANQNGPEEYGFRGNAQNLDLNRDFVKCDSRNAESFAKLLQLLDPDVYIETHVSNGADYQYAITYLSTQPDKLGYQMGRYLRAIMNPALEAKMLTKGTEMVPYVNHHSGPLKTSYTTFYDSPRYSSGLTTLHCIYGFITETHMLKPFDVRVKATYNYLLSATEYCAAYGSQIKGSRADQKKTIAAAKTFPTDWEIEQNDFLQFSFKGYAYGYKKSEVTGEDRLYYNRTKPVTKTMFYKDRLKETRRSTKPASYILRRGYVAVEDRLRWNGVQMRELTQDSTIRVVSTTILDYETKKEPYEKHYLHYTTTSRNDTLEWTFRKGDYIIEMGTDKDRFLVELLEPTGPDSYFNWNFFDAVLQQKEWYSPYVFEDRAAELLRADPTLRNALDARIATLKETNTVMSAKEQLYWIYMNSPHYEKEHNRLPVFKLF